MADTFRLNCEQFMLLCSFVNLVYSQLQLTFTCLPFLQNLYPVCLTVQRDLSTTDWTAQQLPHCTELLTERAKLKVPETLALPGSVHLSQGCRKALPGHFWSVVPQTAIEEKKEVRSLGIFIFLKKGKRYYACVLFTAFTTIMFSISAKNTGTESELCLFPSGVC